MNDLAHATLVSHAGSLGQDAPDGGGVSTALPAGHTGSRRRRLWQLPTQAHELLLAMSFTPDWLRREAARTLGQIHQGQCVVRGQDVDVLYSVVHDLAVRNPVSEALHKHLDARHALALRAVATAKEEQALEAVWARALVGESGQAAVPAALWAVLTHPLGSAMQTAVLYDARAWVFAHARRSVGQAATQHHSETQLQQARVQAAELQVRLAAQQQQSATALRMAQGEVARLRAELARRPDGPVKPNTPPETAVQAAADAGFQLPPVPASAPVHPRACHRAAAPVSTRGPAVPPATPPGQAPAHRATLPQRATLAVAGRRVLCVGGIQHAVARYRGRIEKLGGRFEHHDGGVEDGIQALEARLDRADVVICQAACINHAAYHRIKRHCERTGTPCLYLDRPSLSRLDRALAAPHAGSHAQP